MAFVNSKDSVYSLRVRGKFGEPNGFGRIIFGWSIFGTHDDRAGYYQYRHTKKGKKLVVTKHYWCENKRTEPQQFNRGKFSLAVLAWQNLTLEEKAIYNKLKYPANMTGYNRFLRLYMLDKV